jgi:lysophospholipase L1-like esterase
MRWAGSALAVMLLAAIAISGWAQQPAGGPLPNQEALALYTETADLMESTAIVVPGLGRAAAPVIENVRQSIQAMRAGVGPQHTGLNYQILSNARAYLALYDSVPKPSPFPQEARNQIMGLRESVDRLEAHFRALLEQREQNLRNPDRDNLRRYTEANMTIGNPSPIQPRVVFMGDSITDGWPLNEYFPDRDFVNRGISGQTTSQMLGRMRQDVIRLRPSAVHILAGTNDIARGVPIAAIEDNIAMMAELAHAHGIQVILASVLPVHDYGQQQNPSFAQTRQRPIEKIRQVNQWLQHYAKLQGHTYLDYYSQMTDASGMLNADYADDGLHPNPLGYRIMAPIALEAIGRALAPLQAPGRGRRR